MHDEDSGVGSEMSMRVGSVGFMSTCPIPKKTKLDSGPTIQKPAAADCRTHGHVNADLRGHATLGGWRKDDFPY
jgi:hypothetical protein